MLIVSIKACNPSERVPPRTHPLTPLFTLWSGVPQRRRGGCLDTIKYYTKTKVCAIWWPSCYCYNVYNCKSGALVCYVCFGKEDQLWITHISILSPIFIHSHNYFRRVALAQPAREISAVELDKLRCFDSAIEPHSRVFFFFSLTGKHHLSTGSGSAAAFCCSDFRLFTSLRFTSAEQNRKEPT